MKLKAPSPDRLKVLAPKSPPRGVVRQTREIKGVVVAELGPFKTPNRGLFDSEALDLIVKLGNRSNKGLKSRWTHPGLSSDGLGKHLGRFKKFRRDGDLVRADTRISEIAMKAAPDGGGLSYGEYILSLAEEDPDAFGTSLVLTADKFIDKNGTLVEYDAFKHQDQTPIWRPTRLLALDVVGEGDATNSFLGFPSDDIQQGYHLLDNVLGESEREVVEDRLTQFLELYLAHRYGDSEEEPGDEEDEMSADLQKKIDELEAENKKLKSAKPADESQPSKTDELLSKLIDLQAADIKERRAEREKDSLAQEHAKVAELCKQAGCPEKASKFIEENLSAAEVREQLWSQITKDRGVQTDDDDHTLGEKVDPEVKFGKEWDKMPSNERARLSREDYIQERKYEEKIEEDPAFRS